MRNPITTNLGTEAFGLTSSVASSVCISDFYDFFVIAASQSLIDNPISHPSWDVPLGMEHAPDIDVGFELDIEH
jgi:hypothetical protein